MAPTGTRKCPGGTYDFYWAECPEYQKEAPTFRQHWGWIPSQLVYIACKVYHVQETRKLKQATIFLKTVCRNQKESWDPKGKGKNPLGVNQCTYYKEKALWRKDCLGLKMRNKKDRNPCQEKLERNNKYDDKWGGPETPLDTSSPTTIGAPGTNDSGKQANWLPHKYRSDILSAKYNTNQAKFSCSDG